MLLSIADAYREKNDDVMEQAKMVEGVSPMRSPLPEKAGVFTGVIDAIVKSALKMFDPQNGGFRERAEISPSQRPLIC